MFFVDDCEQYSYTKIVVPITLLKPLQTMMIVLIIWTSMGMISGRKTAI